MLSGPTTIAVAPGKPKAPPYAALRAVRRRRRWPLGTEKRADERGWEMQTLQLRVALAMDRGCRRAGQARVALQGRNVWNSEPLLARRVAASENEKPRPTYARRVISSPALHQIEPDDVGLCRVRGLMSSDCRSTARPEDHLPPGGHDHRLSRFGVRSCACRSGQFDFGRNASWTSDPFNH